MSDQRFEERVSYGMYRAMVDQRNEARAERDRLRAERDELLHLISDARAILAQTNVLLARSVSDTAGPARGSL